MHNAKHVNTRGCRLNQEFGLEHAQARALITQDSRDSEIIEALTLLRKLQSRRCAGQGYHSAGKQIEFVVVSD